MGTHKDLFNEIMKQSAISCIVIFDEFRCVDAGTICSLIIYISFLLLLQQQSVLLPSAHFSGK